MSVPHARLRTAGGTAVRAVGPAVAGVALAAGLDHTTTDSSLPWSAPALAFAVLAGCAYPVLRAGADGRSTRALAVVQALLPLRPECTDSPGWAACPTRRWPRPRSPPPWLPEPGTGRVVVRRDSGHDVVRSTGTATPGNPAGVRSDYWTG